MCDKDWEIIEFKGIAKCGDDNKKVDKVCE
jgi:hypothetical protein